DRRHIPDLRRCAVHERLRDRREIAKDDGMYGEIAHPCESADAKAAVDMFDRRERKGVDVDDVGWMFDVTLHEVDEVRASGDELRTVARARFQRAGDVVCVNQIKWMHCRLHSWPPRALLRRFPCSTRSDRRCRSSTRESRDRSACL